MKPKVEVLHNGPYRFSNVDIEDERGRIKESLETHELCRCGGSSDKPYCDGTHRHNGFTGDRLKEDNRGVKDYVGESITVHDKRYICSHNGTCSLENVFDGRRKPWITPDGAKTVQDVIDICELCPSGALTYSIGGKKITSWHDVPKVVISRNGSYKVQGGVELAIDQESKECMGCEDHYTLCRCGHSAHKPFCDGNHKEIEFKDE